MQRNRSSPYAPVRKIVEALEGGPITVEDIARKIFISRKLLGGGIYAAVNEVVSHLELLIDSGDIRVSMKGQVALTGSRNFHAYINSIID